jgi:hypothetical protein
VDGGAVGLAGKVTVSGTAGPPPAKHRGEYCDPGEQGQEDGDVPESASITNAEEDCRQRSRLGTRRSL